MTKPTKNRFRYNEICPLCHRGMVEHKRTPDTPDPWWFRCRNWYDPSLPDPKHHRWYGLVQFAFWATVLSAGVIGCAALNTYERPPTPYEIREGKIRDCIAKGGDPEYSYDRYGRVTAYYGCVEADG